MADEPMWPNSWDKRALAAEAEVRRLGGILMTLKSECEKGDPEHPMKLIARVYGILCQEEQRIIDATRAATWPREKSG